MSYAIVRNEKLVRAKAQGICVHNDRKANNHSNREIHISRTHLNYYLKKNELNYVKEFDILKEKYNFKGQIRSNSIIMCEMIFTSDADFFNKIGIAETKRYFEESYNFICNYKNLGKENIISAVVHLDESTPHMHLVYVPIIHTKDNNGNDINKVCCRDFWKCRDSYRKLQNSYYEYITSKGFKLERDLPVEETHRKHDNIQEFKNLTNFENTKQVLNSIKLDLPEVPDIKDFKKVMLNRDAKILEKIIKPKDKLIEELYNNNIALHTELSKQAKIVDVAAEFQKEKNDILEDNRILNLKCKQMESDFEYKEKKLVNDYRNKIYEIDCMYQKVINDLEKENKFLRKVIDRFKVTVKAFISWVCSKFSVSFEEQLMRDFEKESRLDFDVENSVKIKEFAKSKSDYEMEL